MSKFQVGDYVSFEEQAGHRLFGVVIKVIQDVTHQGSPCPDWYRINIKDSGDEFYDGDGWMVEEPQISKAG